jgi:hypothetical protein
MVQRCGIGLEETSSGSMKTKKCIRHSGQHLRGMCHVDDWAVTQADQVLKMHQRNECYLTTQDFAKLFQKIADEWYRRGYQARAEYEPELQYATCPKCNPKRCTGEVA